MTELLGSPVVERICLALLHFVWQGFAVMLLAGVALLALRRAAAPLRYAVLLALFAVMLAAPAVTFALLPGPPLGAAVAIGSGALATAGVHDGDHAAAAIPAAAAAARLAWWRPIARPRLLVALWAVGVFVLSLRLLFGWLGLGLTRRRARPLGDEWPARLSRLAARVGVPRSVALLQSVHVAAPTLIGWFRPAILLPAAAVTGLTTDQVEMVLAHELAHLRRSDYLVNLLQAMGETILFYHPAVWWLSRRTRIEREFCCDDLAVRACGDALGYAQVLTSLGTLPSPQPAVGGTGALSARVHRLLRLPAPRPRRRPPWMAGAVTLALLATLVMSLQTPRVAQAAKETAKRVGLKQLAEAVTMYTAPAAPAAPAPAPSPAKPEVAKPGTAPSPAPERLVFISPRIVKENGAGPSAPTPPEPSVSKCFTLEHITAGQLLTLLCTKAPELFAPARPGAGVGMVVLTPSDADGPVPWPRGISGIGATLLEARQLYVFGTAQALDEFPELVKILDRKPQLVRIEAVEVEASAKALVPGSQQPQFPRVVDSARMATMNLQPATSSSSTTTEGRTTTDRLTVTPRINGDRTITLTVEASREVGVATPTAEGKAAQQTTTVSRAEATVCVRDGEPFAMSVPGRGTIIVITPSIVPDE